MNNDKSIDWTLRLLRWCGMIMTSAATAYLLITSIIADMPLQIRVVFVGCAFGEMLLFCILKFDK